MRYKHTTWLYTQICMMDTYVCVCVCVCVLYTYRYISENLSIFMNMFSSILV